MPAPAFFLRTKLLPPRAVPELLSRPRLTEKLQANLSSPVTLVTANAGSGKTTLVADFVRNQSRKSVWYQLDYTDADPAVFLGYLTYGIKQNVEEFGEAVFSYLSQADFISQNPERVVDVFLNEIFERVEQPLILILDDYHHLGIETAVHKIVDRLLAYLPDVLHIIIVSREMPPLTLARMRSQSSLTLIDRSELLFTDEETRELFRKVFDLELTPEQLAEYRERTQGWITALQLVRQVAQRQMLADNKTVPDLTEVLRQSETEIFDYFAEEVFTSEPEDAKQLLLRLSLLERVELETCSRLYPEMRTAFLLPSLVKRNVFVTVASDERGEEYRLHPLFKSFLKRRFRIEAGRNGIAEENKRCANFFLERGNWEQAIQHLIAAEDYDAAARVIAERGKDWITNGTLTSLISFTSVLPEEAFKNFPRALFFRAEAVRLQGDLESAAAMFNQAVKLLHEQNDNEGEAESLHSLATIARRRNNYNLSYEYLKRAESMTDEDSVVRMKCGNTRGLCLLSQGEWAKSEHEFRLALQLAENLNDKHYMRLIAHNLGTPSGLRGDFGEALRWLRRMLRDNEKEQPIPQEATGHLNIARCHFYRGELVLCEKHLDESLELCGMFNLISLRGEVFEAYGNLYRERTDMAHAAEYYERAALDYQQTGIDPTHRELLEEKSLLLLKMGDVASARSLLEKLIAAREEAKDEMGLHAAMLMYSRVLIAQKQAEDALEKLKAALRFFHKQGNFYAEAQACLELAECYFTLGRDNELLRPLQRTLDLAARYDYEYWLQREVSRRPYLFAPKDIIDLLPAETRSLLPSHISTTVAHATQTMKSVPSVIVENHPTVTDLTIKMLGYVEIYRDPLRPFAPDAWTTKRARDILCFIASRKHRRVSKDVIIDTFWGDADFEVVEKNFHPTISHIRKALNSKQALKQNFLIYRDGDYQLSPNFTYLIDTEEFDRLQTEGDAAQKSGDIETFTEKYENALKLYRGEFMQGVYDDWVHEDRNHYREQRLRMMEILANIALKEKKWTRALDLAHDILRDDPFREDMHCTVMRAHAGLGNRGAIKEHYDGLRKLLRDELGVEPIVETKKVFRELFDE